MDLPFSDLGCGRNLLCCASRICCWMRYCWCKAWGRKGEPWMSWNCGAGMWPRGGCIGAAGWCVGPRCGFMPAWDCPGWGIGKSTGIWPWGPTWKCRQEVAWLCWCLLNWDPARTMKPHQLMLDKKMLVFKIMYNSCWSPLLSPPKLLCFWMQNDVWMFCRFTGLHYNQDM